MNLETLSKRIGVSLCYPKTDEGTNQLIDIAYQIGHLKGYDDCYDELIKDLRDFLGRDEFVKFISKRSTRR